MLVRLFFNLGIFWASVRKLVNLSCILLIKLSATEISSHLSLQLLQCDGPRSRAVGNGHEKPRTSCGTEAYFYFYVIRQRVV